MAEVSRAIQCDSCKSLHLPEAETFVTFLGNLYIGETGGVIGNNIETDPAGNITKVRSTVLCRRYSCLSELIRAVGPQALGFSNSRGDYYLS